MKIAIIPARAGSKRIPGKNSKIFCGKPMITWAIDYAFESRLFDKVIVSTDDEDIAQVARVAGADVPFIRPASLSDDLTPTVPVISHAIEFCEMIGWKIDYVCCIYPCVPLLQITDLVNAFGLLCEKNAHYVYPVTSYAHPIQRAMYRLSSGQMKFIQPDFELARTQDLKKSYHDAGQFYWGKSSAWKEQLNMHTAGIGMVVPNWRVVDIDNCDDWKRAELLQEIFKHQIL